MANGSWRAAAFWLERRLPDLYGPRLDLNVAQKSVEEETEEATTPEQRADRLRALVTEVQRRLAEASEPS